MADAIVGQAAETEAARAARELEEVVQRTEVAAREWGVGRITWKGGSCPPFWAA